MYHSSYCAALASSVMSCTIFAIPLKSFSYMAVSCSSLCTPFIPLNFFMQRSLHASVHFRITTWSWTRSAISGFSANSSTADTGCGQRLVYGAVGGKLLGAGGTGFMLLFAAPDDQAQLANALAPHTHLPFQLEEKGCRVVVNEG